MGIGFSLFLIVLGAILRYAVRIRLETIDLQAAGMILMIAGGAGLAISIILSLTGSRRPLQT
jgi:hypothetical protein